MDRISEWVARRLVLVECIPPLLMILAPEAAARLLLAGASYDLKISGGYGWSLAAGALWRLHSVDNRIAPMIITESHDSMACGFTTLQVLDSENLGTFCKVIDAVAPESLQMVTNKIDPAIAATYWPRVIAKSKRSRNGLEDLLFRLKPLTPALAKLTIQLGLGNHA